MPELLVVLQGIHQTLSAERFLQDRSVRVSLVPTPAVVKTGCGFSILVTAAGAGRAPSWWKELSGPATLYRVIEQEGRRSYEEIDRRPGAGMPPAGDALPQGDAGAGPGQDRDNR